MAMWARIFFFFRHACVFSHHLHRNETKWNEKKTKRRRMSVNVCWVKCQSNLFRKMCVSDNNHILPLLLLLLNIIKVMLLCYTNWALTKLSSLALNFAHPIFFFFFFFWFLRKLFFFQIKSNQTYIELISRVCVCVLCIYMSVCLFYMRVFSCGTNA